MIDPITLGALVKTGFAAGKTIKGMVGAKKAEGMGAGLVDPNQQAMMNVTKRMLRARETGTSSFLDKRMNASNNRMMFRRSTQAGGRSLAPYMQMMRDADSNIRQQASTERMGLLGSLVTQTQNIADRKMDLLEQDKAQKNLQAQANKQTGEKNLYAAGSRLGDVVGDAKKKKKGDATDGEPNDGGGYSGYLSKMLGGFSDAMNVGTTNEPQ